MNPHIEELCVPPGVAAPFIGECRYLISLDFDGTLLCERTRCIEPGFFELMQQWRSYGVRWGINTGRSLPYLMQDLSAQSPFLPDFICTCERYIYMADAVGRLLPDSVHNARCSAINAELRGRFAPQLQQAMQLLKKQHPKWQWVFAVDDPLSVEAADSSTMDALVPFIQQLVEKEPTISIQRAGRYLRLADASFDKGSVLMQVAQHWGVPPAHICIIGDGHNDLHAFQTLQTAFCAAPCSAHPDVCAWLREHGGYVSPEQGVLQALRFWADRVF